jgi:AAHS family 4-hydroxybenzoate transporter-like MFS transporter
MQSVDSGSPARAMLAHEHDTDTSVSEAQRWWTIVLCGLVCVVDGIDMSTAPSGVPLMAADWHIPLPAFSFALAASVLGIGLGAGLVAPLGDRFGRRPVIIASFFIVGVATLAVCLTTNIYVFSVLRLLIGFGLGSSVANSLALASEYAITHIRSRIVTTVNAMVAVGGTFGSFVAPLILQPYGWKGIYAAGGWIPLLLIPVLYFRLAESRRYLLLHEAARTGVPLDAHAPAPVKHALDGLRHLLAPAYRPATLLIWTLSFFQAFTVYMISSWMPTLMTLAGWSMSNAVRTVSYFSFGGIFGGFLLGWMVDRGRIGLPLFAAFGSAAVFLAAFQVVPPLVPVWMTVITLMGAGTVGIAYGLAAIAAIVYPTSIRASGIGAFGAVGRVGATLAPLAGGWLLANGFSALHVLTSLIVPMAAACLMVVLFSKRLERPANA